MAEFGAEAGLGFTQAGQVGDDLADQESLGLNRERVLQLVVDLWRGNNDESVKRSLACSFMKQLSQMKRELPPAA